MYDAAFEAGWLEYEMRRAAVIELWRAAQRARRRERAALVPESSPAQAT